MSTPSATIPSRTPHAAAAGRRASTRRSVARWTLAALPLVAAVAFAQPAQNAPTSTASQPSSVSTLPQFTIFVYEPETQTALRSEAADPAKRDAYWSSYAAYAQRLLEAGVMVGGSALDPASRSLGHASPAASEQIGGYFIIQAKDLETAAKWAADCPAARTGRVEIRPHTVNPAMKPR